MRRISRDAETYGRTQGFRVPDGSPHTNRKTWQSVCRIFGVKKYLGTRRDSEFPIASRCLFFVDDSLPNRIPTKPQGLVKCAQDFKKYRNKRAHTGIQSSRWGITLPLIGMHGRKKAFSRKNRHVFFHNPLKNCKKIVIIYCNVLFARGRPLGRAVPLCREVRPADPSAVFPCSPVSHSVIYI